MSVDHYTYRVTWSSEDGEHVGLCAEFPLFSWLSKTPRAALAGIRKIVAETIADLKDCGEPIPEPLADCIDNGVLLAAPNNAQRIF